MLRIVTGPFHPTLEQALVHRLQEIKRCTPLASLSLVLPSETLRYHVQWLLAKQTNLSLLNVHFFTFYQLAQRLLNEPTAQNETIQPIHIASATIFKELIRQFLRSRLSHGSPLQRLIHMPGAWAAIWSTFKDLKDAGVSSETEAIAEVLLRKTEFSNDARSKILSDLLTLYAHVNRELHRHHIGDYEDLSVQAKDQVSTSQFLRNQHEILYYGFYDLTQIQLDFFHQVVREYPSHCFFPLVHGNPSYLFAERFFDRYIRGRATDEQVKQQTGDASQATSLSYPNCRVFNVRGHIQEVEVVAKEILGLVEERGYAFQDIGVISRTMAGYESVLPSIFSQHDIPFQSSIGQPLSHYPFVKALIHLLEIPAFGFRAEHILKFLSSHFSRKSALSASHGDYPGTFRPDHWQLIRERLGIQEGVKHWTCLEAFFQSGLSLGTSSSDTREQSFLSGEQIRWVSEAIHILHEQLASLSEKGTWASYVENVTRCMDMFLDPLFMETHIARHYAPQDMLTSISRCLEQLRMMNLFVEEVPFSEFFDAMTRMFNETTFSEGTFNGQGVQVLDAMEARGISFRALFLLGLNESVFPRHIQEDAFLRDDVRRALETDLGYKISEKMDAYHEEELLFSLLTSSAQQELTLLYVRSDDEGRTALPSSYLDTWKQKSGSPQEVLVPTRQAQRNQQDPSFSKGRLTPDEYLIEALLHRRVPSLFLKTVHPQGLWLTHCLNAVQTLDAHTPLGFFDGITGPIDTFWEQACEKGFSPTSLERYASCPFQYFSSHVLGIEPQLEMQEALQVGPREIGLLVHSILRTTMEKLQSEGFFTYEENSTVDPSHVLEQMAAEEFKQFAEIYFTGFPLLWEMQQEEILLFLRHVLKRDLEELKKNDWEPVLFEKEMIGTLTVDAKQHGEQIKIRGFLDRIDRSVNNNAYRIVDYKYKVSRNPGTFDTNLGLAAIRGIHLQPPLYLKMIQGSHGQGIQEALLLKDSSECRGVWFYYLAPYWKEKEKEWLFPIEFSGDGWRAPLGPVLNNTIRHIIHGIKQGQFFIMPGAQCESCGYRLICRNNHQPTLSRARMDPLRIQHVRTLKKAQLP